MVSKSDLEKFWGTNMRNDNCYWLIYDDSDERWVWSMNDSPSRVNITHYNALRNAARGCVWFPHYFYKRVADTPIRERLNNNWYDQVLFINAVVDIHWARLTPWQRFKFRMQLITPNRIKI